MAAATPPSCVNTAACMTLKVSDSTTTDFCLTPPKLRRSLSSTWNVFRGTSCLKHIMPNNSASNCTKDISTISVDVRLTHSARRASLNSWLVMAVKAPLKVPSMRVTSKPSYAGRAMHMKASWITRKHCCSISDDFVAFAMHNARNTSAPQSKFSNTHVPTTTFIALSGKVGSSAESFSQNLGQLLGISFLTWRMNARRILRPQAALKPETL
mmetsp:Transcript_81166/g.225901  ORF Transcript_81166/g.225901 Transcript_81166/m.225901 type:complete len:212 (-) Transcript_81166:370-1005(-)